MSKLQTKTHPDYIYQQLDIHSRLGCAAPPSTHAALVKRHRGLVESVETHAPKHPAGI